MKTLIKKKNQPTQLVDRVFCPVNGLVTIRVKSVGLCRSDLAIANGTIALDHPVVLGHEFSGVVGDDSSGHFRIGQKVAVNPLYPDKKFLGLDLDGALCEYLQVPAEQVIPTDILDFQTAAYIEPVAASMAVLKAKITKNEVGAVYGKNRIAELTYLILQSHGYNITWLNEQQQYPSSSFDYIVETLFEEKELAMQLDLLKDNGLLVVKSRKKQAVGINPSILVAKEITLQAVNYYNFGEAMTWLERNSQLIQPLLGNSYPIEQWEEAFAEAQSGEANKTFIHFE